MTAAETYEVVIVKYGTRQTTRSEVFLNYPVYGEPDGPIGMDYFFWVARNETRTVVIDTGFSRSGGSQRNRTMLVDPLECFEALGLEVADEPPVVVTHGHYDHIGNLGHFARSPVIVARREVEFWAGPHGRRAQFHHSVEDTELADLQAAVDSGRAVLFDDDYTVADGIEVRRVGGHTPGQSVVTVRTSQGVVLLASDAVHYYEELDREMPFVSVANLVDMYAGFTTVNAMLAGGEVDHLVTGHDPSTFSLLDATPGPIPSLSMIIGQRVRD
ncbi:N-acyl homoserine lactonase family protein [Nocardioides sp.]|uniref:N-acyl homoserine lactonase family protein n=1 Tax=Nocardioides sp. TaxID=35761 RepID=UPI003D11C8BC